MLEALREACPEARFYQASSSEMFGKVIETPQTESTPFYPRSPYGVAKCYGHFITVNYRESYGMHRCHGILFNHERPAAGSSSSPARSPGTPRRSSSGWPTSCGWATSMPSATGATPRTTSRRCGLMLQLDPPEDFVIATGESNTVRRCVEIAFDQAGIDWAPYVKIDDAFKRPAEVDLLVGDPTKAKRLLGWEPKTNFEQLIRLMVDADLDLLSR